MTLVAVVAGLLGVTLPAADARAPSDRTADRFTACHQRLAAAPEDYDSAYCFYAAAFEARLWDQGTRVFERLMRARPANFWLPLALGHLHRNRQPADPDAAEASYRRAAEGFRAAGHAEGEILARSNLRDMLLPMGRVDAASAEVARVTAVGASADDPLLRARVWSLEATHLFETGGDLGLAYRLLQQAEKAIFPAGPYRLRRTALTSLGRVALSLGRVDEALIHFGRLKEQARAANDLTSQAVAHYNILNAESMRESLLPTPGAKERLLQLARQALAVGQAAAHTQVILKAHRVVAALLANVPETRAEALDHAERCLALAADARQQQDEAACAWMIAILLHDTAPRQSRAAHVRALRATDRASSPVVEALNAGRHMQFSWLVRPRPEAIRDSLEALDALETIRSLQEGSGSSAEVFSTWTLDYYWLSGRLLLGGDGDLDLAFSVAERLRARTLLEARERGRAAPDPRDPAVVERGRALREIAAVQRTLMDPMLQHASRQVQLDRLAALEAREQESGRQIARLSQSGPRPDPAFASVADVQSALGPDEALLSFQLGVWDTVESTFGGGAWLTVLTRDRRAVYRIPDRAHFAPLVPVFNGLLSGGDGREVRAAVRLHGDVFSNALHELPPRIARLIIVPDGPLHHLPFDALRAAPGAAPLAARYELAVSPSATLWLDTRRRGAPESRARALVLADPELSVMGSADAAERQAVLQRGFTLGRLPYARHESRALSRYLPDVDALVGPVATEHAIKTRALRDYELVHFAAHAVADETHPGRSAVFLAPGDAGEDGLLQAREIGELDFEGRIVVLSACQTAAGAVLSGEGVLSLARAFFQGGARAVVGTRWHVRDEDAASLFETFYRALGKGATVSAALAQTKARAIAQGRRPAVWAGLVLLGEGESRPFPTRPIESDTDRRIGRRLVLLLIVAIVAGLLALKPRLRRAGGTL
jgi:hypothetical protein